MFLKIDQKITRFCEIVLVCSMILITADTLVGVFFRYVLGSALSWVEELARYSMIYMGFIGAGLVLREEGHINVSVLIDNLPPIILRFIILVGDLLIILFLGVWFWYSLQTLQVIKSDISSGLGIRLMWAFLAMPVCSGFMIIQQFALILTHIMRPLRLGGNENAVLEEERGG